MYTLGLILRFPIYLVGVILYTPVFLIRTIIAWLIILFAYLFYPVFLLVLILHRAFTNTEIRKGDFLLKWNMDVIANFMGYNVYVDMSHWLIKP